LKEKSTHRLKFLSNDDDDDSRVTTSHHTPTSESIER